MAGNIVKWWKHKILGGYKHFSVLKECSTDSEELICQVRTSSACSAPPDLLMVSEREVMHPTTQIPSKLKEQLDENQCKSNEDNHTTKKTLNIENFAKVEKKQRIRLEEFTCDVSVENGKSSQPIQFSFTFYDLEGHHNKITKEDIAGIVYTIYESIGKSLVVPHYGSKTIKVRLTLSSESKAKYANKRKKGQQQQNFRRHHRYRSRKLIKSEKDEKNGKETECNSEKDHNNCKNVQTNNKYNRLTDETDSNQKIYSANTTRFDNFMNVEESTLTTTNINGYSPISGQSVFNNTNQQHSNRLRTQNSEENIYESAPHVKCCNKEHRRIDIFKCRECQPFAQKLNHSKQIPIRSKCLQKTKTQKTQENFIETRQRSLSVGNESTWKEKNQKNDGFYADHSISAANCWNNALKRKELINIIRESMEKNKLCFQSNGKLPTNGSPIHYRKRSHTMSKVLADRNSPQKGSHHFPIYHQQLAINPPILSKKKTNLCGYDSFLHATICASVNTPNNSTEVPTQITESSPNIFIHSNLKSSKIRRNEIKSPQNSPQFQRFQGNKRHSTVHGHSKLNTTFLNTLKPHLTSEEKLMRTIDRVKNWLDDRDQINYKLIDSDTFKHLIENEENFDNLLYLKLWEKLNQTSKIVGSNNDSNITNNNKDMLRRLNHINFYHQKQQRNFGANQISSNIDKNNVNISSLNSSKDVYDSIKSSILNNVGTSDEDIPKRSINLEHGPKMNKEENTGSITSTESKPSLIHRYIHEHIHHHYYHFENQND